MLFHNKYIKEDSMFYFMLNAQHLVETFDFPRVVEWLNNFLFSALTMRLNENLWL